MSVAEALAYHRSLPSDYGGYFPVSDDLDEDDEPAALLEVEVEVNIALVATAD